MNIDTNKNTRIENSAIIIMGASGDLTRRKLIPAINRLYELNQIDDSSIIIGSGRTEFDDDAFRARFDISSNFSSKLFYHQGLDGLKNYMHSKGDFDNVIIFLALPPAYYASSAEELYNEGFDKDIRLVIEKPFGYSYESASKLNSALLKYYDDSQIFRIDHYLGKEAVQNLLVFRFANSLFSQIWNNKYIDSIQINAYESIGVENRGAYFDKSGIIRDMVQNHLTQLLSLLTMEAPASLDPEDIRAQKMNILKNLRVADSYRYQYKGYLDEDGVPDDSTTETYAEVILYIDDFRWYDVPIYIRTGKALHRKGTEIGVNFKPLPKLLFNKEGAIEPNKIIFKIQPAEGIIIDIASKIPGYNVEIDNTHMSFCYVDSFNSEIPEAYQKLLFDVLIGDRTLFVSAPETELAWKVFDPILDKGEIKYYEKGVEPKHHFRCKWIDFDKYADICSKD